MSPEAYHLAAQRIELEVREATRKFSRTVGAQHEEFTSRGVGTSSMMINAIYDLSSDVDDLYEKHRSRMKGIWPTLEEPRESAAAVVESEIGIDSLARQRKRIPLDDVLRVPRYEVPLTHWRKAKKLAERSDPDVPNAVKEATLALESLEKLFFVGVVRRLESASSCFAPDSFWILVSTRSWRGYGHIRAPLRGKARRCVGLRPV